MREFFEEIPEQPLSPETIKDLVATIDRLLGETAYKINRGVKVRGKIVPLREHKKAGITQLDWLELKTDNDEPDAIVSIHDAEDRAADIIYNIFHHGEIMKDVFILGRCWCRGKSFLCSIPSQIC